MIHGGIPQADVKSLEKTLNMFDHKIKNKWIKEATRHSHRVHILPFVRKATPDGSGMKSRGRSIYRAGLRNAGGTKLSAGTYRARKSTGKLRRSWKIQNLNKRSKYVAGSSVARWSDETFYAKFIETGRTHNLFLPMRKWKKVPESWKGKGKRLWRDGHHIWKAVADRRGPIATNAAVRRLWWHIRQYSSQVNSNP
jgi:hypothetical protein